MKYFGLSFVVFGIGYAVYVHKSRARINIYVQEKMKTVLKETAYFRMQYKVGIINSIIVTLSGLIFFFRFSLYDSLILFVPLTAVIIFNVNHYLLFRWALKNGLVERRK